MKAVIYKKETKEVYDILKNIAQVTETEALNDNGEGHRGINPLEAGVLVVADDVEIEVGDIIDPVVFSDIRDRLPLTPEQEKDQRIADLELALADQLARNGSLLSRVKTWSMPFRAR